MANPYTEVTVSSYNANPPSDDGSTASTNQLKWSNHKTKLGDPLKTAIESTQTNLTTAFGKVPFIDKVALTTTHNQVAGDRGKMYTVASGTFTINLLAAATAGSGYTFGITNYGSGAVTLDPNGSETINGAATIVLYTGGTATVTCDGSNWFAVGGSFTTATTTELNLLDGVTATTAEINYLSGVTSAIQTQINAISQFTILSTPEQLATGLTEDAWTTINSSTLGTAGATAALIRVYATDSVSVTASQVTIQAFLRKTGSALSNNQVTQVMYSTDSDSDTGGTDGGITYSVVEAAVSLDSGSDFDYYITSTTAALSSSYIHLIGYWAPLA